MTTAMIMASWGNLSFSRVKKERGKGKGEGVVCFFFFFLFSFFFPEGIDRYLVFFM